MTEYFGSTSNANADSRKWEDIKCRYLPGTQVHGIVKSVLKYGIYTVVHKKDISNEQIVGFIRNEEISWEKEITDARDEFCIGQSIQAVIMYVDESRQRLVLSLRRLKHDPWDAFIGQYGVGQSVEGVVEHITNQAVFIEIDEGVRGRMYVDEIVPFDIEHPSEILKAGDDVKVKVVRIDESEREIVVSLREEIISLENDINTSDASKLYSEKIEIKKDGKRYYKKVNDKRKHVVKKIVKTILIADDDNYVSGALKDLLILNEFEVDTASSREDVIEMIEHKTYDLIIMDVNMPAHIEGIKTAEAILKHDQSARILLHTGIDNLDIATKEIDYRKLGICGLLPKPADSKELIDTIREIEKTGHSSIVLRQQDAVYNIISSIEEANNTFDETLEKSLEQPLHNICIAMNADAGMILHMHPQTYEIDFVALHNIPDENFYDIKHMIRYSPIKDILLDEEHLVHDNIDHFERKFKYLRPITTTPTNCFIMQSCIGVPIQTAGHKKYGVILFSSKKGIFQSHQFRWIQRDAVLLGSVINERIHRMNSSTNKRFELLGQMTASVGHELRGYLTALGARLDVLKMCMDTMNRSNQQGHSENNLDTLKNYMQYVLEVKDSMFGFVRSFMEITKAEQVTTVKIGDILDMAVRAVYDEATRNKIAISTEKRSRHYLIELRTIPVILQQVFVNLLLNGIHHMHSAKRKKGRIYIMVDFIKDDARPIKIRFRDTGPGIHHDIKEIIFEPMFSTKKSEDGKESIDGTGLGLSICRSILGTVGGRIKLEETAIMLGSTFLVELPLEGY